MKLLRIAPAEKSLKLHWIKICMGFAYIADGLVILLSFGFVFSGFALETAKQLSLARFPYLEKQHQNKQKGGDA